MKFSNTVALRNILVYSLSRFASSSVGNGPLFGYLATLFQRVFVFAYIRGNAVAIPKILISQLYSLLQGIKIRSTHLCYARYSFLSQS